MIVYKDSLFIQNCFYLVKFKNPPSKKVDVYFI
jgi:hypothetical protein